MRFHRNTRILRVQWDAAPIAGLFFILILFLLLQSSFVFTPGVTLDLAESYGMPGEAGPRVALAVDAAGQLIFDDQVIEESTLREKLKRKVADSDLPLTLIVSADRSVPTERWVAICQWAKDAGFAKATLATRPTVSPKPTEKK